MRSFNPVGPKPKGRRPQEHLIGQNMRQLHTFIASGSAKKAKNEARPTPKGACGHQPRGCPQPSFVTSFEEFNQKSETVDMWTRGWFIILKASNVHRIRGGGPGRSRPVGLGLVLPPWHIGGSPFTVHGKVCHPEPGGLAFPRKER